MIRAQSQILLNSANLSNQINSQWEALQQDLNILKTGLKSS